MAKSYLVSIVEFLENPGVPPANVLVRGSFSTFKQMELALERGLKASIIPRKKKAPAKKAKK